MYAKIKIGHEEVAMLANAASPYLFKSVFHEDFLLASRRMTDEKDPSVVDSTAGDLFVKMGFILAKQAECKPSELTKLSYDDFLQWLWQFEPTAVLESVNAIASVWSGQEAPSSVPKNQDD